LRTPPLPLLVARKVPPLVVLLEPALLAVVGASVPLTMMETRPAQARLAGESGRRNRLEE
jgi:hypothetical protein